MVDKDIKRFCELVTEIAEMNKKLDKERENFYDGGRSFEECNSYDLEELVKMQYELRRIIKKISKPKPTSFRRITPQGKAVPGSHASTPEFLYNEKLNSLAAWDGSAWTDTNVSGARFYSIEKANNNGWREIETMDVTCKAVRLNEDVHIISDDIIGVGDPYLDQTSNEVKVCKTKKMYRLLKVARNLSNRKIIGSTDESLGVLGVPDFLLDDPGTATRTDVSVKYTQNPNVVGIISPMAYGRNLIVKPK